MVWSEVKGREVVERSAGSADDDPFSEFEELDGVAPVREIEEAVGTHQVEEGVVWQELMEGGEGLDCVIGCAVGVGCVQGGDGEAGVGETGQGEHGDAVAEGGGCAVGLERLAACGGEENLIQMEGVCGSGGDGEVAAVGRVEGSAEECYAHGLFSRKTDGFWGSIAEKESLEALSCRTGLLRGGRAFARLFNLSGQDGVLWPSRWSGSFISRPTGGPIPIIPARPVYTPRSGRPTRSGPVRQDIASNGR